MKDYDSFMEATKLINKRMYCEAETILREVLEKNEGKNITRIIIMIANALFGQDRNEEAYSLLDELSKKGIKEKFFSLQVVARQKVEENNLQEAEKCYEELLEINKENKFVDDFIILLPYGKLQQKLNNYKKVKVCFEKVLEEDKDKNKLYCASKLMILTELIKFYNKEDNLKKVNEYLEEAFQIYNDNKEKIDFDIWPARFEFAKMKKKQGNFEEAKKIAYELLEENNKFNRVKPAKIHFFIASLEIECNRFNMAKYFLNKIISSSSCSKSDFCLTNINLGKIAVKENDYDLAKKLFKKVIAEGFIKYVLYANFELAKLYKTEGKIYKAKKLFEFVCTSHENDSKNKDDKLFAELELAKIEVSVGKFDTARYYLSNVLNGGYKNAAYATLEFGKLERLAGNYELAKEYFNSLLNGTKKDIAYALAELGKTEMYLENYELAKEYFNKSMSVLSINRFSTIQNILYTEVKQENYIEAYIGLDKLLLEIPHNYSKLQNLVCLNNYIKYKLGKFDEISDTNSFFTQNLFNYDKQDVIDNIKKHSIDIEYVELLIPIEDIYEECSKKIQNIKPIEFSLNDKYIIELDSDIATIDGIPTNKIVIYTYLNSKNIVNFYPFVNEKYIENEINKQKKLNYLN